MLALKILLAAGMIFGGEKYLVMLRRSKQRIDLIHFGEVIIAGALFMGAVHLAGCAFYPEHLVHLTDKDGKPVKPDDVHVDLGDLHYTEIFSASLCAIVTSYLMFVRFLPWPKTETSTSVH